jgi:tRNA pseudouridine55 synthase
MIETTPENTIEKKAEKVSPVGFLLIHKPLVITSFDCIRHIKKVLKLKTKIGHAGTLDDFAQGLLLIGIGREATRMITQLSNLDKAYTVKAKLGELTDSLDFNGKVLETQDVPALTLGAIQKAINALGKSYDQIPPIYSALKHEGRPLYKLARNNLLSDEKLTEIAQTKSRKVTIHAIELLDYQEPYFTFTAHVSKGTYIRSLADDIAQKLDLRATTLELSRTNIGSLSLGQAVKLEDLKTREDLENKLISIEALIAQLGHLD